MGGPRHEHTRDVHSEEGCLFFDTWHRSVDDPNEYVCVEAFRDDDAAVAPRELRRPSRTSSRWLPDLVSAQPKIINTTIDQDDWGPMGEISPAQS